jgi:hypothetical protein
VQALPLIPGRTPARKDHILTRNKYPDTVLNCAVSSALEGGLLFISTTCFPCDSQGVTCITLHFFTNCYEMFTSDTQERAQERNCPGPSHVKEDAHVAVAKRARAHHPVQGTPGKDSAGGLFREICTTISSATG